MIAYMRTQAPVVRQKLVPLQNLPSARGCKFPFVICNEEKEGRREESGTTEARGESMTLCLTFGLLPWTLEDTDLRWYVSCQSPSDKLSLWSRIFLYFVCAQILGYLLQVSSTHILITSITKIKPLRCNTHTYVCSHLTHTRNSPDLASMTAPL